VIADRGERNVIRNLASNTSALFSDAGYNGMVDRAEADDELTEILGLRIDLPFEFLRVLLYRATEAVRARLSLIAPPNFGRNQSYTAGDPRQRTSETAGAEFQSGRRRGETDERPERAKRRRHHQVRGSQKIPQSRRGLGILNNSAPTEMMMRLLVGVRADLILIPCKSAGLGWIAVEAILCHRPVKHQIDEATLKLASMDYARLSVGTAERTVRFWQLHDKTER